MYNSNLALQITDYSWTLPRWSYLVNEVADVFRLTNEEKECFSNNLTARIIATIPFEAGCNEPERTSIAHLCLYIAEKKGLYKYCSHKIADDANLFKRLEFISTFDGGNQEIILHGMNILALIMIEGYKKSKEQDEKNGIYNPFVSGVWNYQNMKNKLLIELNKQEIPNFDWILKCIPLNKW